MTRLSLDPSGVLARAPRARHVHRRVRWRGLALLALGLASCRAYELSPELARRIEEEARGLPRVADDDAVREAGNEAGEARVPWPVALELPDGAGLDDYVRLALERNPRITARVRDLEALGMRVPRVSSLADPMLRLTPPTGDMTETAGGMLDGGIGISQAFPLPAKLESMGRIAEQVVRVALENLRSERLAVAAEVKQAYFTYYLATVSIEVVGENQRLLERLRNSADAKYAAGSAAQQDVLRAEVELYSVASERITLEQGRRTAVARLNLSMDRDVTAGLPEPSPLDPVRLAGRLDELLARAAAESPELKAWQERTKGDLEAARLARLQYLPDFSIGGFFTFVSSMGLSPVANGDDVWSLDLGLSLPIRRARLRAGVLERNAQVLASALRYRSTRNDVFFAVQDLFVRVEAAYQRAVLLRDGIVPRARQAVRVSEIGYESGEVDFLTVIDNWQRLLDLTLAYHGELTALERELAELEQVVGGRIERVPQAAQPDTGPQNGKDQR